MMRLVGIQLVVGVVLGVCSAAARAEDPRDRAFRVPLVDSYAVVRSYDSPRSSHDWGAYQVVRVNSGSGFGFGMLVPHVEQVAVHQRVIFGKTKDEYFILEVEGLPRMFKMREEWKAALHELGVVNSEVLKNPDALAEGLPENVLRPWKYTKMRGCFGWSDDAWSLAVQGLGFLMALVMGIRWGRRGGLMLGAIVLGLGVNVLSQIIIADGGPGAFVGFFFFPVFCVLLAALGRAVRGAGGENTVIATVPDRGSNGAGPLPPTAPPRAPR